MKDWLKPRIIVSNMVYLTYNKSRPVFLYEISLDYLFITVTICVGPNIVPRGTPLDSRCVTDGYLTVNLMTSSK